MLFYGFLVRCGAAAVADDLLPTINPASAETTVAVIQ
jgi:hypothetical protein